MLNFQDGLYEQLEQYEAERLKQAAGGGWQDLIATREPHDQQRAFIESPAKFKVIRAGRRGGKTTGIAILCLDYFKRGHRVLYTAPTEDQVETFWFEIKQACIEAIARDLLYKNENRHILEVPNTKNRIRAKTAWDADSLRGDYGDLVIFDEWQLTNEEAWSRVGAPMLMDNDGDAVFIYTPPSLHSKSRTKARDPRHAAKMFKEAAKDTTGEWVTFHFTSLDNPHIHAAGLDRVTRNMTRYAYEQEILAEDKEEAPGALWTHRQLDALRVTEHPEFVRVVVGVDPPGGATECGIVVGAIGTDGHGYVIGDYSLQDSPAKWGAQVVAAYHQHHADRILGEKNYGGDMVENTIRTVEGGQSVSYKNVVATRGKAIRAEPVAALYEQGKIHHVGTFPALEDEMCNWEAGRNLPSPNRLDALVWAMSDLMLHDHGPMEIIELPDIFGR